VERAILAISGIPGVGKTTVAGRVARSLARGVHIESDLLQKLIVSGGLWPDQEPREEARRQLRLRVRNAALLADSFFEAGFTPVIDDVLIGSRVDDLRADLRGRPLLFVMLVPRLDVVDRRDAGRPDKRVFHAWKHLDEVVRRETPRVGLWLDTSEQTPEETAAEILRRAWQEARVP